MPIILTGDRLREAVAENNAKDGIPGESKEQRMGIPLLADYLSRSANGRIWALHGLRRTGKTTMMLHAISNLPETERKKSAYILFKEEDTVGDIEYQLDELHEKKCVDHFFIDEVTLASDFIRSAHIFSDDFAKRGMHVVLSGTDSLGFRIVEKNALYNRVDIIPITWIPFSEHHRLLETKSIVDYVTTGGILSQDRERIFREYKHDLFSGVFEYAYVDNAIGDNLEHTVAHCGERYKGRVEELRAKGLLKSAVHRIINNENHRFAIDIVRDEFPAADLRGSLPLVGKPMRNLLRRLNLAKIAEGLVKRLDIVEDHYNSMQITQAHIYEIFQFLQMMDIVRPRSVLDKYALQVFRTGDEMADYKIISELSSEERVRTEQGSWLITQPGLRWTHVDILLDEVNKRVLFGGSIQLTKDEKTVFAKGLEQIRNIVLGRILEEIVLLELMHSYGKDNFVFTYRNMDNEIDIIKARKDGSGFDAYEVKYSFTERQKFGRHMRNPDIIKHLEPKLGKMLSRNIIYSGDDTEKYGCRYLNAEKFLMNLPKSLPIPRRSEEYIHLSRHAKGEAECSSDKQDEAPHGQPEAIMAVKCALGSAGFYERTPSTQELPNVVAPLLEKALPCIDKDRMPNIVDANLSGEDSDNKHEAKRVPESSSTYPSAGRPV